MSPGIHASDSRICYTALKNFKIQNYHRTLIYSYHHNQAYSEYKTFRVRDMLSYSNETRAPIANPPNSAQLEGTPTIPPSCVWVRAVVWERDRHRDRHTEKQTRVTNISCISPLLCLTRNVVNRSTFSCVMYCVI